MAPRHRFQNIAPRPRRLATLQATDGNLRRVPPQTIQRTSATLYASAVGCFQASLNGVPVSDSVLDPGFSTDYTKRILYRAFDVLKSLREKNALGVRLGFCKYGCKSKMSVL